MSCRPSCRLCGDRCWFTEARDHYDENGQYVGTEQVQAECPYSHEPGHAAPAIDIKREGR